MALKQTNLVRDRTTDGKATVGTNREGHGENLAGLYLDREGMPSKYQRQPVLSQVHEKGQTNTGIQNAVELSRDTRLSLAMV